MGNKVILGKRPETFKRVVTFKTLDDAELQINCEFKYRTKTEFGAFIDGILSDAGLKREGGEEFSMSTLMEKTVDKNAYYLLEVLKGWDLEVDLVEDAARQLCDELPAAATAIMEAYSLACREGRLGN